MGLWREILQRVPYVQEGDADPPCRVCGVGTPKFLISERTSRCDRWLDMAGFSESARANAMWNFFGWTCNDCIVQACIYARRVEEKAGRTWEDRDWRPIDADLEVKNWRFDMRHEHFAEWLIRRAKAELSAMKKRAA